MKLYSILLCLTLPVASMAQTTVFSDNFNSGSTVDAVPVAPTPTSASYEAFGSSASGAASLTVGDLRINSTTAAAYFGEIEAVFASSPITLTNTGDSLNLRIVFTGSNILSGTASNSSLCVGLFNSGGSLPAQGYKVTSGTTGAPVTGFAQNWVGYIGQAFANSNSRVITRPPQTTGSTGQTQDVLFSGASGSTSFNSPTGTTMSLASSGSTNLALAAPTLLTVDYTASISGSSTLALDYIIYSGSGISGTQLFSRHAETTLVTGTNTYQGTTFDSLGLGWRQNNGSLSSSLDINSVAVTLTSVPEPTTVAMMAGGIGLFFGIERLVKRRRG